MSAITNSAPNIVRKFCPLWWLKGIKRQGNISSYRRTFNQMSSSCISHQLLCVGSHYVDISLLKSCGLKEKNTWDLKVIVKKGLKKLTETVLSLTISCLTALQNVTENTPEITEICVKHFPFFLKLNISSCLILPRNMMFLRQPQTSQNWRLLVMVNHILDQQQ